MDLSDGRNGCAVNYSRNKRTAIVTGAAGGLGRAISKELLRKDVRVAMFDKDDGIFDAAAELEAGPENVRVQLCDITAARETAAAVEAVEEAWGGVDILVNNAGIAPKHPSGKPRLEDVEFDEWRSVMAVNLDAPFRMCQLVLPHMRKAKWGRVVNMSSGAGRTSSPTSGAAYGTSKAGLLGFTRMLATEVALDGITVNSVAPGRIETPPIKIFGETANSEYRALIPMQRLGDAEEVAAAVVFLASEDASYITGATIDVNGGRYMG